MPEVACYMTFSADSQDADTATTLAYLCYRYPSLMYRWDTPMRIIFDLRSVWYGSFSEARQFFVREVMMHKWIELFRAADTKGVIAWDTTGLYVAVTQ